MTYRTASFEHEGHRLVYDEYGAGDHLVVYMHGLLLDSELNRGIADAQPGPKATAAAGSSRE